MSRIADAFRRAGDEGHDPNGFDAAGGGQAAPPPAGLLSAAWPVEDSSRAGTDDPAPQATASAEDVEPPVDRDTPASHRQAAGGGALVGAGIALPQPSPSEFGSRWSTGPSAGQPLTRYWNVVRRRWRVASLIALVVVGGVAGGVWLQSPVYRATGLLEIRPESAVAVPLDTLFSGGRLPIDELETQFGILKSATLAEHVAGKVPAETRAEDDRGPKRGAPRANDAPAAGQVLTPYAVRTGLKINPLKGSRLVEVSFEAPDPVLAARVVNTAFDSYLHLRMEEAQRSADWLEAQLRETQLRLERAERELQAYVRKHGLQVFETGQGEAAQVMNERLQSLRALLARAEAERMEKQSAEEQARARAADRDLDSPVVQDLSVRLADLRQEEAKLTSVFHDEFPRVQIVRRQIAELQRELDGEMSRVVSRSRSELLAATRREALLRQALQEQERTIEALGGTSASSPGYEALKRELVTTQQQFAVLSQKLKDVSVSAALKASNVGIVDRATPPKQPINASAGLSMALALVVGLLMAGGVVLVQEHLDTSIRTVGDVDSYLGVPTLATIPAVGARPSLPGAGRPEWRRIGRGGRHEAVLEEAFAALRTSVLIRDEAAAPPVMLITSAHAHEGKTTVAINLALSLARLNSRVILIDANMRSPCVQEALGLRGRAGDSLVGYLEGHHDWRSAVLRDALENLDVILGGTPHESPADLLSLPRMRLLIEAAARDYDFVIVDSPALLVNPADVQSLAAVSGGVLLVVRQGRTPRDAVSLALAQLGHVVGVVLNQHEDSDLPILRQPVTHARSVLRT